MASIDITFPGNLAQVDTADDLRGVPSSLIPAGTAYIVSSLTGIFLYYPGVVTADNGTTVLKPNDITPLQAGRWIYTAAGFARGPAGTPGGNITSIGFFTAIAGMRFDGDLIGVDQIYTSGYRTLGIGAARLLRFKAPLANLPAMTSGANAWWTTAADGSIWYVDPSQEIDLDMFGTYANDVNDDYPAWLAANQFCVWRSGYQAGDGGSMGGTLRVSTRSYRSSQAWTLTTTMRLVGSGTGMAGGSEQNRNFYIRFYGATDGIVVGAGATGSAILGLSVLGPSNAPSTYAGVRCLTRATVLFNNITRFGGYGVRCNSNDGGNNNGSYISFNRVTNIGGSGVLVQGGDGNAFTIQGNDISGCANWGIEDRSFLGGDISGGQIENCGSIGSGGRTAPGTVSYGGRWWAVLDGQETAASTTAPGTNGAVWFPIAGAGTPGGQYPLWVSGTTYRAGGALLQTGVNAIACFQNLYVEPDCGPVQILGRGYINAGDVQVPVVGGFVMGNINGSLTVNTSLTSRLFDQSASGQSQITSLGSVAYGQNTILSDSHSVFGNFRFAHDGSGNIVWTGSGGSAPFYITGSQTTVRGGGAGNIDLFGVAGFLLSGGAGGAKKWIGGGGPPTTGTWAYGDRVWNDNSGSVSIATTSFWHCTVAGTPGTWAAKA